MISLASIGFKMRQIIRLGNLLPVCKDLWSCNEEHKVNEDLRQVDPDVRQVHTERRHHAANTAHHAAAAHGQRPGDVEHVQK